MNPFFKINESDIISLDDSQARELIARLCKAELVSRKLPPSSVLWGGDQRAKDGGIDVLLDNAVGLPLEGYLPRADIGFQVKAEKFPASNIPDEMAPKGKIRPAILELANKSGAYIIVSSRDSCSHSMLKDRIAAIKDCFKAFGITKGLHYDFYDAKRLSDWVERHPSVLVWVREIIGKPLEGWRHYGAWSYQATAKDEFLVDEKSKVYLPNSIEPVAAITGISRMRETLREGKYAVRLVGLSGVGKTRLAQALFDSEVQTDIPALHSENVIYTDLSDTPNPSPDSMIESLILANIESVVVVDNCGQALHRRLVEITHNSKTPIRLLTIEYDIRDDEPVDTSCFKLEASSDDFITKIVKRRYKHLSTLDIRRIASFSDGNARVALALASTSEKTGEVARLRDEELFARLFVQRQSEDDSLLRSAETASLLYSFNLLQESASSELSVLSGLADVSVSTFLRHIAELQRRGLVQTRGDWRAVLPHAIANRLAIRALENSSADTLLKSLFTQATDRVKQSFTHRLSFLHEAISTRRIVSTLLDSPSAFSDVKKLDKCGIQSFSNLAPINPRLALDRLISASEDVTFLSITNTNRWEICRLLRSLAYDAEMFVEACDVLSKFALIEPESENYDSCWEILQSLFYLHLSGTLAPPESRISFVNHLASSPDETKRKLALHLVKAGLEAEYFSCSYSFDFGALKRSYGWHPTSLQDHQAWYGGFLRIASEIALDSSPLSSDAKALLGSSIANFCQDEVLMALLTEIAQSLTGEDGWADGWLGGKRALKRHAKTLSEQSKLNLLNFQKIVLPNTLRGRIEALVLSPSIFALGYEEDDSDDSGDSLMRRHNESLNRVQELGAEAARVKDAVTSLIPILHTKTYTGKLYSFGVGVGLASSEAQNILSEFKAMIASAPGSTPDLQFVLGLIQGWGIQNQQQLNDFLESAVDDEVWGVYFPYLESAKGPLDSNSHKRLIRSLDVKKASSLTYSQLGYGAVARSLTIAQLGEIIDSIASKIDGGLAVAIDVLYMAQFGAKTTDTDKSHFYALRAYSASFVAKLNWPNLNFSNQNTATHLKDVIEFAVATDDPHNVAGEILEKIQKSSSSVEVHPPKIGSFLLPIFKARPLLALESLFSLRSTEKFLTRLLSDPNQNGATAFSGVTAESFIQWCSISEIEDRFLFAASQCAITTGEGSASAFEQGQGKVASVAIAILQAAPNKLKVLQTLGNRLMASRRFSESALPTLEKNYSMFDELERQINTDEFKEEVAQLRKIFGKRIEQEKKWQREIYTNTFSGFE